MHGCLIPLLNGKPYQENTWRISRYSIKEIFIDRENKPWALLSLQDNEKVKSLNLDGQKLDIPEVNLIIEFNLICQMFHVVRRTKYYIQSKLNLNKTWDNELDKNYQRKLHKQIDDIIDGAEKVMEKIVEFTSELAEIGTSDKERVTWQDIVEVCLEKYEGAVEAFNEELSDEENKKFWSDTNVDYFLGQYLNAKYQKD